MDSNGSSVLERLIHTDSGADLQKLYELIAQSRQALIRADDLICMLRLRYGLDATSSANTESISQTTVLAT